MFFTYLRRELRRRMRQAVFISLGLALGIGLVITVTAASAGVKDAQGTVLHALYGVGTDVTVTKAPKAGSGLGGPFGFRGQTGTSGRPAAGTKISIDTLRGLGLGTIGSSSGSKGSGLRGGADAGQDDHRRDAADHQRRRRRGGRWLRGRRRGGRRRRFPRLVHPDLV